MALNFYTSSQLIKPSLYKSAMSLKTKQSFEQIVAKYAAIPIEERRKQQAQAQAEVEALWKRLWDNSICGGQGNVFNQW